MDEIPISISPEPIKEAIIEIRFNLNDDFNIIFGLFFSKVKNLISKKEELTPLPKEIVEKNPRLKYTPRYRLHVINLDDSFLHFGPNSITFINRGKYPKWEPLIRTSFKFFESLFKMNVISNVERLGVRYINFFNSDILEKTEFEFHQSGKPLESIWKEFAYTIQDNDFINRIMIQNNANFNEEKGTIIDIDTYKDYNSENIKKISKSEIEVAHKLEKKYFYKCLKKSFVTNELNAKF